MTEELDNPFAVLSDAEILKGVEELANWWRILRTLRQEWRPTMTWQSQYLFSYDISYGISNDKSFEDWVTDNYGIKIIYDRRISTRYQIVDEKKHLVFMLKYM